MEPDPPKPAPQWDPPADPVQPPMIDPPVDDPRDPVPDPQIDPPVPGPDVPSTPPDRSPDDEPGRGLCAGRGRSTELHLVSFGDGYTDKED